MRPVGGVICKGGPLMNTRIRLLAGAFAGVAIAAAGCATTPVERVDEGAAKLLAQYDRTGEVTSCLGIREISSIRPVTEKTFLVRVGANQYYVNDISGRCSGATMSGNRLQYSTSLSQLCRNEIIHVVDNANGFNVGSCGLGSFEKLKKKPDAEPEEQQ